MPSGGATLPRDTVRAPSVAGDAVPRDSGSGEPRDRSATIWPASHAPDWTADCVPVDAGVQLLTPGGERRHHSDFPLEVTAEELRGMYREMVLVRRLDAEGTALQRQGELGMWIPSLGQEAAQVGSARAFAPTDMVFPSYREHAVALARGVTPAELLGIFRGVGLSGWDPEARRFGMYAIVLGAQTLHAVGYAMAAQWDGSDEAVAVYFGDGASSQGDVAEALNWAAVTRAPVVFCCQNNQWAISVPTSRQTRVPLYRRAEGYGLRSVRVDGNDVLAVLAATRWALRSARSGSGPAFVESYTYRMGPHTTSDDPSRYRDEVEVERWRALDPITRLRRHLDAERLADADFYSGLDAEADALAAATRQACFDLPIPPPEALFDAVHAEEHPDVARQRAEFTAYQRSFLDPC